MFVATMGCNRAGTNNTKDTAAGQMVFGSVPWVEAEREKFQKSISGIDWAAFAKGYSKTTFYRVKEGDGFTRYAPYKLDWAKMYSYYITPRPDFNEPHAMLDLHFKGGEKGTASLTVSGPIPGGIDPNRVLAEEFSTHDPFAGASKYIRDSAKHGQLAIGMTKGQVMLVKGGDFESSNSTYAHGTSSMWVYRGSFARTYVHFENDRVSSFSNN